MEFISNSKISRSHCLIDLGYEYKHHLNLPDTIFQTGTANRIVWRYDALGNKLSKEVYNDSMFLTGAYTENSYQAGALLTDGQPTALDSTVLTARDSIRFLPGFHAKPGFSLTAKIDTNLVPVDQTAYIGGIEYRNNQLQAIYHPEGRATPDSSSWRHEYVITDHLGNTRVRFSDLNSNNSIDSTELLSTHDYFSYGMEWETGGYKYTYNGKEENWEHALHLLDFGARIQDPALGRFTSVDRFAEKYTSLSGYSYAAGNPVKFVDVNGDSIFVDNLGYITRNGQTDNLVFLADADGNLIQLGELGGQIDVTIIYKNLLAKNSRSAAKMFPNPFKFRNKVKGGGDWDLKNEERSIFGLANHTKGETTTFLFGKEKLEAQDIGNHHFGVVGRAFGLFSEEFMLKQAGEAQIAAGTSKPEWQRYRNVYRGKTSTTEMLPPYGDDPRDQLWIKAGFDYYINNKRELRDTAKALQKNEK